MLKCVYVASAQNFKLYGGVSYQGVNTDDFNDFHISDWERFRGASEGRVNAPLSSKNANNSIGAHVGAQYDLGDRFGLILEGSLGFGNVSYYAVTGGINYNFISGEKFKLGISPRVGYSSASANFGEINLIDGFTAPVIITEGTFTNGDRLSVESSGIFAQVGLVPEFRVNEHFGIRAFIGYGIGFGGNTNILVETRGEEIEIPLTSPAVLEPISDEIDAYNSNPKLNLTGLVFQLGVSYNLGELFN